MATLTAATRKEIPGKEFAGPDRSYPIPDKSHAANAKARAKQQLDAGRLNRAGYDRIVAKANKKLGSSAGGKGKGGDEWEEGKNRETGDIG